MRTFTVEEANALLPRVRRLVGALRGEIEGFRHAAEQVDDLRRMWGAQIDSPSCRDHAEFRRLLADAERRHESAEELLAELKGLSVEVKDPLLGLVDFFAEREGELVYLCWQDGEASVAHWHPIEGGYAARRPV